MLLKIFLTLVVLMVLFFLLAQVIGRGFLAGKTYNGEKKEFFKEGAFFMPGIVTDDKGFKDMVRWQFGENLNIAWDEPYTKDTIPYEKKSPESAVRIMFVNHATTLIESNETAILTDPIFTKRASPFSFMGPERHHEPYLKLEDIPKVDLVLISHNHYDHLDLPSLKEIEKRHRPTYVVPLNNGQFLKRVGIPEERIQELNLFESVELSQAKVSLENAQHWSVRGIGDRNRALWGSYVIELAGKKVFFAGDTGYNKHFAEIREKYSVIDVAILPIGAYEPRWFMQAHHMNPEDALQAARDLGNPKVMGLHFGTFKLTNEARHDPQKETEALLQKNPYPETFLVPTLETGLGLDV